MGRAPIRRTITSCSISRMGRRSIYNDPRRFGFMVMMAHAERAQHALFRDLGAEPLGEELTAEYLASKALGKKVNLKAFLMDQHVIAGLGNIYVSEALYQAGLSPDRAAASLANRRGAPTERAIKLVPAIRDVLERAIEAGGSTLRDYRHADGKRGRVSGEVRGLRSRRVASAEHPGAAARYAVPSTRGARHSIARGVSGEMQRQLAA